MPRGPAPRPASRHRRAAARPSASFHPRRLTGSEQRGRIELIGLLAATAVSVTGTRMSLIAVPWLVLVTTGSPWRTGVVGAVEMGALAVARVLGGPVVDRVGARRASVLCDLGSAVAFGLVPLLYAADALTFTRLLVLVGLAGLLRGPGDSAKYVLVPALASRARMPGERAAGLADGVHRLGSLVGAPVGGLLVAALGAPAVIAIDAASFVLAAMLVAALVHVGTPVPDSNAVSARPVVRSRALGRYLRDLHEGLGFLLRDPLLRAVAGMLFFTNLLDQAVMGVLLPAWAFERYGNAKVIGLYGGVFAAGAVLGTLLIATYGPRLPRHRTYSTAFLIGGAPRILALALPLPGVISAAGVSGVALGTINPLIAAAEYDRVPEVLRGRVFGALGGIAWAGIPFGGLMGGWLVERYGVDTAIVVIGVAYGLVTLDPLLRRSWRLMDRRLSAR